MKILPHLLFIFVFFLQKNASAQTDTFVLKYMLPVADSLYKNPKGPVEILTHEQLLPFVKMEYRYQPVDFDFSRFYLYLKGYCIQCAAVCKHNDYYFYSPCHRNACSYSYRWQVASRQNTRHIPFEEIHLNNNRFFVYGPHQDTIIVHDQNIHLPLQDTSATYIYLHRLLTGDCHVRFRHEIYLDENRKTITWHLHKIYGGCRAGYLEDVFFRIKNPGKGYKILYTVTYQDE